MDVTDFITQLLPLFATVQQIQSVTYAIEGPVVDGNAIIVQDMFLRFYYNAVTGTTAFALIQNRQRIVHACLSDDHSGLSWRINNMTGTCEVPVT